MKKHVLILLLMQAIITGSALANGITVQKVSLADTNKTAKTVAIKFNLAWENSWRDSINWDAAWIFVKFREPKDSVWRYRHLTMAGTGNTGTGPTAMKFAFPDDKKGVFYYRAGIGSGHIKMDSIKLAWNYGLDSVTNIDSVEIKVFATEMVYIPGGHFSLGDGNGKERSINSFHLKNAPNNYVVITNKWSPLIFTKNTTPGSIGNSMDDASLVNDGIRISGEAGIDMNGDKVAEFPDYPTGYRSFYCMKYDVTQGQYADFLNTLSLRDLSTLPPGFPDTTKLKRLHPKFKYALQNLDPILYSTQADLQRHTISLDTIDGKYTVSRPDRALAKGNGFYYTSFSDWSAMRPMSELEFEKTARGPLPPSYKTYTSSNNFSSDTTRAWSGFEWAWGNDTAYARAVTGPMAGSGGYTKLSYSGIENGTESFSNYNIYKRYLNPLYASFNMYTGGDGGDGPFRVGIFANDTTGRISSGASYYGVMDLSKNISKMVVSIGYPSNRYISYKKHGDGMLDASGRTYNNEFSSSGSSQMGDLIYIRKMNAVSDRSNSGDFFGFRCVRTAPSDH